MLSIAEAGKIKKTLKPCPESPNCVSTLAEDASHKVEPIAYSGDFKTAKAKLLTLIRREPRTQIISSNGTYVHATFKSLIFRFKDDVEFVFDIKAKLIHVRSASRVGYSDFGVNRKRVEDLRVKYSKL